MKKMKFTLGLMLSMLILGASVASAQTYDYSVGANYNLAVTATVSPCSYYAADVTVKNIVFDPIFPFAPTGVGAETPEGATRWTITYPMTRTVTWTSAASNIPYGANAASDWSVNASNQIISTAAGGSIFYWLRKSETQLINRIDVKLAYVNGNELKPRVLRTITLGRWGQSSSRNIITPGSVKVYDVLTPEVEPDSIWFRQHMDRMDGVATYIYKDNLLPLFDKYVIASINYEIIVGDEFDNDVQDIEVLGTLPKDYIGVQLAPDDGITTDPNHLGGAGPDLMYYVPNRNFEFTAFSNSPIEVSLGALYASDAHRIIPDAESAVVITDNKNGSFTIRIKQIMFNYKISITSVTATSEEEITGNQLVVKNAVWAASGRLFVQTDTPATLSIYSVTGQLVKQVPVSGSSSLALPKGLYIVQLNGKAFKVIN